MTEALFGLLGVVVGSLIPWIKEVWSERRLRSRHARYLAMRIVCTLDQYVDRCIEVVQDDGLCCGQRNQDGCLEPQVLLPAPPVYPDDVDWKCIDHELMYSLLALPNEAEEKNRYISFVSSEIAFPPDYEEAFEARQYEYSVLGLSALELAQRLRLTYKIPEKKGSTWNPEWNPHEYLTGRKSEIDQYQKAQRSTQLPLSVGADPGNGEAVA
jgi:hypothetical protein